MAQTIAVRSMDEAETFAEAQLAIKGRLNALAHAYTLLANAKWEGAPLRAVIRGQLGGLSNRIKVTGCDIVVIPSAAQQFGLTRREQETVELLTLGLTSKEIASRMNISPNTVKAFFRLIFGKEIPGSARLNQFLITFT